MWQCKWRHLVAKLVTNASSAAWWPKLKSMESLTWIFFLTEFVFFLAGEITSYRINTLGPLCHLDQLKIGPPSDTTCIRLKFGQQVEVSISCQVVSLTLPWNALLALSVSIEFVFSSARVTSV